MKNPKQVSIIILVSVVLFTAFCGYNLQFLEFDYNFEKFFPQDDEDTQFFEEHRTRFSSDNDYLLIGLQNEEGILRKDFLLEVDSLLNYLDTIPNVDTVICFTRDTVKVHQYDHPLINYAELDSVANDSIWISKSPDIYGTVISEDWKSIMIFLKHKDYLKSGECYHLSLAMEKVKEAHEFDKIHIAGRSVGQPYYVQLMQEELGFFTITSFILLVIFLILAFRSWWGVLLPVLVVVISTVWIMGIMALIGKPINLVLTVLPTIMFVVGMSDVIHITSKYLEELRNGHGKIKALGVTIKEVGLATLLTSITTSVGFLTLYTSNVVPIQDFGLYVAFGVMIAFVLSFLLLPSMFALIPTPKVAKKRSESTFWTKMLRKSFLWTIRNQWKIGLASIAVLAISLFGMKDLEVNNFLLEDLKPDDPMNKNFVFFDEEFSGVRPLEISVESKSGSLLTEENLRALDSIETIALGVYPNKRFLSINTVLKHLNRGFNGGTGIHYRFPQNKKSLRKSIKALDKAFEKGRLSQYLSEDGTTARISTTVKDLGGNKFREMHEQFFAELNGKFPQFEVKQTGTAYLIDKNNQYLSTNMIWSLGIAFAVIAVIVGLLYRSPRMVMISLIPNIFPLVMIAGIMGFMGVDIKVSTSILFTIAFGIAVDDTIHFVSKLKLELAKGRRNIFAVRRTYMSTGRAIVLTTGILCAGFLTLLFSNFLGTFYMGLLITLALFFALISDLFLLPVLVLKFFPDKASKKPIS